MSEEFIISSSIELDYALCLTLKQQSIVDLGELILEYSIPFRKESDKAQYQLGQHSVNAFIDQYGA